MRDAAQQPDPARALEVARRRIAELEAQLAEAKGHAPLAAVEGVPAVLVHAVANAPEDGQVVRLERGVIAVVGPGGSPGEVWEAVTAAAVPANPGPARPAAAGAPGAVRVFARRLPPGLLALSVPDGSDGRDLILSAALPPGHRRRALRMAHRASRLRPAAVAAAVAARFAGRAVSVSRAHFGHAALAAGSLTAAAAAAFVLLPATSPAPASPGAPAAAAGPGHSARDIAPVTAHHQALGRRHLAPAPVTARSRAASPAAQAAASPSGLLPSLLPASASPSGLVGSLLPSPPVSVSASPPSSGSAGGACPGVAVLGVCVPL